MADAEMVRAFAGEYRRLTEGLEAVLAALDERVVWPVGEEGVRLCELANTLRDGGAFLGFHRLSALARIMCELLRGTHGEASPAAATAACRRLFAAACRLAAQFMRGIESRGVEPVLDAEWAHVADLAKSQGLALQWKEPSSAAPAETSDEQRLATLLSDDVSAPVTPPEPAPLAAADLAGVFVQDAVEILDQAERDLLRAEQEPDAIHDILRHFHTLKGNSGLMGYDHSSGSITASRAHCRPCATGRGPFRPRGYSACWGWWMSNGSPWPGSRAVATAAWRISMRTCRRRRRSFQLIRSRPAAGGWTRWSLRCRRASLRRRVARCASAWSGSIS